MIEGRKAWIHEVGAAFGAIKTEQITLAPIIDRFRAGMREGESDHATEGRFFTLAEIDAIKAAHAEEVREAEERGGKKVIQMVADSIRKMSKGCPAVNNEAQVCKRVAENILEQMKDADANADAYEARIRQEARNEALEEVRREIDYAALFVYHGVHTGMRKALQIVERMQRNPRPEGVSR